MYKINLSSKSVTASIKAGLFGRLVIWNTQVCVIMPKRKDITSHEVREATVDANQSSKGLIGISK